MHLTCTRFTPFRAILQIRQFILPFHLFHPANSWSFTYQQVDYHSTARRGPSRVCIQGGSGRPGVSRDTSVSPSTHITLTA
jgi:hypothetical protein